MEDEAPDLRVGVLAARTFITRDGRFRPLNAGQGNPFYGTTAGTDADKTWWNAAATAKCWAATAAVTACSCGCGVFWQTFDPSRHPDHAVPDPACTCGIYSFTDAQEVATQYGNYAAETLAVIAPEGQAMEGTRGWRAEKATILAAWVKSDDARAELRGNYPTVRFYAEIADLFRDYPTIDNGGLQKYRDAITEYSSRFGVYSGNTFTFTGNSFVLSNPAATASGKWFTIPWPIPDPDPEPEPETLEDKAAKALATIDPTQWANPLTDPTCPIVTLSAPVSTRITVTDRTWQIKASRPTATTTAEPYYLKRPNGRWAS